MRQERENNRFLLVVVSAYLVKVYLDKSSVLGVINLLIQGLDCGSGY